MGEREQYQRELQAQLDAWKKDVAKLKSISSRVSADARATMRQHIAALESRIEECEAKLSEISGASEEAWAGLRDGVESSWSVLKKALGDAAQKFKG